MTHIMALLFEAAEGCGGLDVSQQYSTWKFNMFFSIILLMQDLLILSESGEICGFTFH